MGIRILYKTNYLCASRKCLLGENLQQRRQSFYLLILLSDAAIFEINLKKYYICFTLKTKHFKGVEIWSIFSDKGIRGKCLSKNLNDHRINERVPFMFI